jgi:hypothetical protein
MMNILGMGWFIDLFVLVVLAVLLISVMRFLVMVRSRASRFGYPSTGAYLRSAPRSDAEKQDAADLALRGLVFCLLGLIFSPFVLIGLIPLFYGGRKLVYASMGLGLVDDPDQPEA